MKHLAPLFPLPRHIMTNLHMIASIMDYRVFDRESSNYQPVMEDDFFDSVAQKIEKVARDNSEPLPQIHRRLREQAESFLKGVHRYWPGHEAAARELEKRFKEENFDFRTVKPDLLEHSRRILTKLIETNSTVPWLLALAEALSRPRLTSRDTLAMFVEVECARAVLEKSPEVEKLSATIARDLNDINPTLNAIVLGVVCEAVSKVNPDGYPSEMEERAKGFYWPTRVREKLASPDLSTKQLVALWMESFLISERVHPTNYGARVERRMAAPGRSAADTPDDIDGIWRYRRVQYVLRGIPTKQAQTAAANRANRAIQEAGIPIAAVPAGTSSVNFYPLGQSKENALAMVARFFGVSVEDLLFSDDKPDIGEVWPAANAVGTFIHAGKNEPIEPLVRTTVIRPQTPGPAAVEEFIHMVAGYLETVAPGATVTMSHLPAHWKDLMRQAVGGRFLEHLRQGSGPFESIGGRRLAARADFVGELLFDRTTMESLVGKAEIMRAGGVRYVIYCGAGGVEALASLVDQMPAPKTGARIFSLDHVDPMEIQTLREKLIATESTTLERLAIKMGSENVQSRVWKRALQKSMLVVVAKGLSEEGRAEVRALTQLVTDSFSQIDSSKPSNHVVVFAQAATKEDDRNATEWNWAKSLRAQRIPFPNDGGAPVLKRHLHPGLPFAFLLALRGIPPSEIFKAVSSYNQRGESQDGFVRLAAWLEGYFREGKKQVAMIFPPSLESWGPLTSRTIEPILLQRQGVSPQVAYGLPLSVESYPSADRAQILFVHVRLEGVSDKNAAVVEQLRAAGHPVAVVTLPQDPAVAFGVWMEGFFRLSSILGAYENHSLETTLEIPEYQRALAQARNAEPKSTPPPHFFEGMGVEDQGVFKAGLLTLEEVNGLLARAGVPNPNGADRYAAALYLLHKKNAGNNRFAEIRYLGTPSSALRSALKKGQDILSLLLKIVVRLGGRMSVDYTASLVRPVKSESVLLDTLVCPSRQAIAPWSDNIKNTNTERLREGYTLRVHQQAIIETLNANNVPNMVLILPQDDREATKTLAHFFDHVDRRFRQFNDLDQTHRPTGDDHQRERHGWLFAFLVSAVDFLMRTMEWISGRFNIPTGFIFYAVPPNPSGKGEGSSLPGRRLDPMNFRDLPKKEILEILQNELGDELPFENREEAISAKWPDWYGTDQREKPYPVVEIQVRTRRGQVDSFFVKPSNFFLSAKIGFEMQRILGEDAPRVWSVPGWYVAGDAGLDCPTTLKLLTTLWEEAMRSNNESAKDILGDYMTLMNREIGKMLATEVILGYIDGIGKNVMVQQARELRSIMERAGGNGFDQAIQWLREHPPRLGLFDFEPRQFMGAFHLEHFWEPGGVDYMMRYARESFNGLLNLSRAMGVLNPEQVKEGFLDQMNNGVLRADDLTHYLDSAVPHGSMDRLFDKGFLDYFQQRLDDDPDEWFEALLADTVLFDHKPTFPFFGNKERDALIGLERRLADGNVRRTANIFDLDGDPRALERALKWVESGRVDEVIVHGDVFDRGDQNQACFDTLKRLKDQLGNRLVVLLGNHEVMMIEALILRRQEMLPIWLANGGESVLREYGANDIGQKVAQTVRHLEWLPEISPHIRGGGLRWSHLYETISHILQRAAGFGSYQAATYDYELFLNDPKMKPVIDLAWWVLNNARLHYVDDKGWLHLHAGMPLAIDRKPMFTSLDLKEAENRLRILLKRARAPYDLDSHRQEQLLSLFHKFSGIFWVRKSYWIYRLFDPNRAKRVFYPPHISPEKEDTLRKTAETLARVLGTSVEMQYQMQLRRLSSGQRFFVTEMGDERVWLKSLLLNISPVTQGIMIGHNRVDYVHNVDNMFYCADLGRPITILAGPDGVQFVDENDDLDNPSGPFTLLTRAGMVGRVQERLEEMTDNRPANGVDDKNPNSLAYLLTGQWEWGVLGMLLEWAGGVSLSSGLTSLLLACLGGAAWGPVVVLSMGLFASALYGYSNLHARADKNPSLTKTHDFFVGFFPYLALPPVALLAPGWFMAASVAVLVAHVVRDLRSKMGREMFRSFADNANRLKTLMPDAKKGTYSVDDLLGAVSGPSEGLGQAAREFLDSIGPTERIRLLTQEEALTFLCHTAGVDRKSVALIPLPSEILAHEKLIPLAKGAITLHGQAVFYVEANTPVPLALTQFITENDGKAVLVTVPKTTRLFDERKVVMATLETLAVAQTTDVQTYLPPSFSADDEGVKDKGRFGANNVRPMGLLLEFEKLWELVRLISTQA